MPGVLHLGQADSTTGGAALAVRGEARTGKQVVQGSSGRRGGCKQAREGFGAMLGRRSNKQERGGGAGWVCSSGARCRCPAKNGRRESNREE